ncbi:hypothetical protein [Sessilibacter corallicola]|uniref:hypothetical protein n=1 Tax=Sessilibacter corallicola TaxID=2904075 RepID=UPI001E5F112B|nr:hypothetical protein [Sessilibacter corallicola]MCE2026877.1 hypothetical protein [Sessilibacter corallicola]
MVKNSLMLIFIALGLVMGIYVSPGPPVYPTLPAEADSQQIELLLTKHLIILGVFSGLFAELTAVLLKRSGWHSTVGVLIVIGLYSMLENCRFDQDVNYYFLFHFDFIVVISAALLVCFSVNTIKFLLNKFSIPAK